MPRDDRLPTLVQDYLFMEQSVDVSISFGIQNISHSLSFKDWSYDWWDLGGNWCTPRLGLRPVHTKSPSSSINSYNPISNIHGNITGEAIGGYGIETLLPEWCDSNNTEFVFGGDFIVIPQANTYLTGVYELTNIAYPQLNDKYMLRFWMVPEDTTVTIELLLLYLTGDPHNPEEIWDIGPFEINITNSDLITLLDGTISNLGNVLAGNYILTGGPLTSNNLIIEFNGRMSGIRTQFSQIPMSENNLIVQQLVQASQAISSGGSTSSGLFNINGDEYRPLANNMFRSNWDHLDVRVFTNYLSYLRELADFHGFPFNYALYYVDGNLNLVRENYTNDYGSTDSYNASGQPWNVFKLFDQVRQMLEDISINDFGYYYWGNPLFAKGVDFTGGGMTELWDDYPNILGQTAAIYTGRWTWDPSDITTLGQNGKYTQDNFQSMLPNYITNLTTPTGILYPAMTLIKNDYWYTIKPCNPNVQVQTIIDMTSSAFNLSTYNYFSINGDKSNNGNVLWRPITDLGIDPLLEVYGHYDIAGILSGVYNPGTNFTLNFSCINLSIAQIILNFSIDGVTSDFQIIGVTTITPSTNLSYWCPKSPQTADPSNLLYFVKVEFWKDHRTTTAGTSPIDGSPLPATTQDIYTVNTIESSRIPGTSTGQDLTELLANFLPNTPDRTLTGFSPITGITTTDVITVVSTVVGSRTFTDEKVSPNNPNAQNNGNVWWTEDPEVYTTYSGPQAYQWTFNDPSNTNRIVVLECTTPFGLQPIFEKTSTDVNLSVNINDIKTSGRHYSIISAIFDDVTGYPMDINNNQSNAAAVNQSGFSILNNIPIVGTPFGGINNQNNAIMSTIYETSLTVAIDTKGKPIKGYLGAVLKDSLYTGLRAVWGDLTLYLNPGLDGIFGPVNPITGINQYWSADYYGNRELHYPAFLTDKNFNAKITVKYGSINGRLRFNTGPNYTPVNYGPIPVAASYGSNVFNSFAINQSDPINDAYQQMYSDMVTNAQSLFTVNIDNTKLVSVDLPFAVQDDFTIAMDALNDLTPTGNIIYFLISWSVDNYAISDTNTFKTNTGITKDTDSTTFAIMNGFGSTMIVNKDDTTGNRVNSTFKIGQMSVSINDNIYKCQGP